VDVANILNISAIILSLMIAIIGHEIMHGRMALFYHDKTAKEQGRLSINPIVHIDPVGTIIVPLVLYFSNAGFLFGWAKPVPVNMRTVLVHGGHKAGINVALAGIYFNFSMAVLALLIAKFITLDPNSLFGFFTLKFLYYMIVYNVVLGTFNLFIIPPLDGSKALMHTLAMMGANKLAMSIAKFEQYGMILLILIIATPLSTYVFTPIAYMVNFFLSL
jgi:Zn-dependent protease